MELKMQQINSQEQFEVFQQHIASAELPTEDLDYKNQILLGYYDDHSLIGTGGLELFGPHAILRSLTVKLGSRKKSMGSGIVDDLLQKAKDNNIETVYLLTESAKEFFMKKGFTITHREQVPAPVKASSEFSYLCGASAVCMKLTV